MADLTSEDEGKGVVAADGAELGTVDEVDGDTLYIALDEGVEVNWGETDDDRYVLAANAVESVGEDDVHLRGER